MRKVFFSFAWEDAWRAFQIRNHNIASGVYQTGYKDEAEVEEVKKKTDEAIYRWIDKQLENTTVTCVLIGEKTYNSKFVLYEIQKSIQRKNGLLGIYIHNLKDKYGSQGIKGINPFEHPDIGFTPANTTENLPYPCASYYIWNWSNEDWKNFGIWIEKAYKQANPNG